MKITTYEITEEGRIGSGSPLYLVSVS